MRSMLNRLRCWPERLERATAPPSLPHTSVPATSQKNARSFATLSHRSRVCGARACVRRSHVLCVDRNLSKLSCDRVVAPCLLSQKFAMASTSVASSADAEAELDAGNAFWAPAAPGTWVGRTCDIESSRASWLPGSLDCCTAAPCRPRAPSTRHTPRTRSRPGRGGACWRGSRARERAAPAVTARRVPAAAPPSPRRSGAAHGTRKQSCRAPWRARPRRERTWRGGTQGRRRTAAAPRT